MTLILVLYICLPDRHDSRTSSVCIWFYVLPIGCRIHVSILGTETQRTVPVHRDITLTLMARPSMSIVKSYYNIFLILCIFNLMYFSNLKAFSALTLQVVVLASKHLLKHGTHCGFWGPFYFDIVQQSSLVWRMWYCLTLLLL